MPATAGPCYTVHMTYRTIRPLGCAMVVSAFAGVALDALAEGEIGTPPQGSDKMIVVLGSTMATGPVGQVEHVTDAITGEEYELVEPLPPWSGYPLDIRSAFGKIRSS